MIFVAFHHPRRFVLEKRMGDDPATLPRGSSVECREEDLGIVAALRFGGLALDRDVR